MILLPARVVQTLRKQRDYIRGEMDWYLSNPDVVRGANGQLYDRNAIFANTILQNELEEFDHVLSQLVEA